MNIAINREKSKLRKSNEVIVLEKSKELKIINEIGKSIISLEKLLMRNALVCDDRPAKL